MNSVDCLMEIINKFRKIDDFEKWYKQQNCEEIYALFNEFIYYANKVIKENLDIKIENNKLRSYSNSLRKHLSKLNINEKEIDTILHGTKYCKRCNKKITMEIFGLNDSICYGCLDDREKEELINFNLGK